MINRRSMLLGATGGILFALTGIVLTRGGASIRFIGQRETIIALLDTGSARILTVLGEPNDWLMENIPGLSTVGNSGIDLVVGSHRVLTSREAREHLKLDDTPTLVLQGTADLPSLRGNTSTVIDPTLLALGGSWSLRINPLAFEPDHPDFAIEIQHDDLNMVLVNSLSALKLVQTGRPNLLAIPGEIGMIIESSGLSPDLLVLTEEQETVNVSQLVVFPSDPEIVRIRGNELSVREDQLSS